jgi:hypothetical protein
MHVCLHVCVHDVCSLERRMTKPDSRINSNISTKATGSYAPLAPSFKSFQFRTSCICPTKECSTFVSVVRKDRHSPVCVEGSFHLSFYNIGIYRYVSPNPTVLLLLLGFTQYNLEFLIIHLDYYY